MGKLLPVIIAVVGLGIGAGAGLMLKPEPAPPMEGEHAEGDTADGHGAPADGHADAADSHAAADGHGEEGNDYVKLNNQFIIPIVHNEQIAGLVALSISLEVGTGQSEFVYQREPKLRDALLQVMFDHANAGGFDGTFTDSGTMTLLRKALLETSRQVLGPKVTNVLITDIVRQDA